MTEPTVQTPWIDVLIDKLRGFNVDPIMVPVAGALLDVAKAYQSSGLTAAEALILEQLSPEARILRLEQNAEKLRLLSLKEKARMDFIRGIPGKVPWTLLFVLLMSAI